MKLKTNILLLISISIILLTIIAATFWESMGLGSEESPILAFAIMISFGINIAGLIFSFFEISIDKKKSILALMGHLILIISFFGFVIYALSTMN